MKYAKTLSLLCESGMLAIKRGKFDSAQTIFLAIREIAPSNVAGNIGLASVALAKNEIAEAISLLEPAANSNLENAFEAKKLLLVAIMLSGDKQKAGQIHQHLVENTSSTSIPDQNKVREAQEFFG